MSLLTALAAMQQKVVRSFGTEKSVLLRTYKTTAGTAGKPGSTAATEEISVTIVVGPGRVSFQGVGSGMIEQCDYYCYISDQAYIDRRHRKEHLRFVIDSEEYKVSYETPDEGHFTYRLGLNRA